MFNLGGGELVVIALIALIVLGPDRLPEAARTVGKVMGEVRKLSSGFQDEVRNAFTEAEAPASSTRTSSPLAQEVAELDRGDITATGASGDLPAIETTSTDVTDAPVDRVPGELAPDVADALGEVLAGPGAARPVLAGVGNEEDDEDEGGEGHGPVAGPAAGDAHRAAS